MKMSSQSQPKPKRKRKGRLLIWFLTSIIVLHLINIWTTTPTIININKYNNPNNNNKKDDFIITARRNNDKKQKQKSTTTSKREERPPKILPPKILPKKGLLFDERLDYALNLVNKTYLNVQDVEFVERIVFDNYYIPVPITLLWPGKELPLDYRYPTLTQNQCGPNCNLITLPPRRTRINDDNVLVQQFLSNNNKTIDGLLHAIPYRKIAKQLNISTVCGCGEALTGTGKRCFNEIQECTYQHSFKRSDNLWTSYSRLQFLPEKYNITTISKLVEQILTPYPHSGIEPKQSTPLVAMHSNCNGQSGRGTILKKIYDLDNNRLNQQKQQSNEPFVPILHSFGKCWHNQDIFQYEPPTRSQWHWKDSEGNRDTTKTDIASHYKVTAALENTFDIDYFTEKRFQALVSGSVPLLFRKPIPYSENYLPHPKQSAIFVDDYKTTEELYNYLRELSNNDTLYYENHQKWKINDVNNNGGGGISKEFVQILFHGLNFLPCRTCELIAKEKILQQQQQKKIQND